MAKQARGKVIGHDLDIVVGEDDDTARALGKAAILALTQRARVADHD
jgi:hypothetical protein